MGSSLDRLMAEHSAQSTSSPGSSLDRLLSEQTQESTGLADRVVNSVGRSVRGAVDTFRSIAQHPVDALTGIPKGIAEDFRTGFIAPVQGSQRAESDYLRGKGIDPRPDIPYGAEITEHTAGSVTPNQARKGGLMTAANIGLGVAPAMTALPRVATNAGLGAIADDQDPLRGAIVGGALGEALHATTSAIGKETSMRRAEATVREAIAEGADNPVRRRAAFHPTDHATTFSSRAGSALDRLLEGTEEQASVERFFAARGREAPEASITRRPRETLPMAQRLPVEPAVDIEPQSFGIGQLTDLTPEQRSLRERLATELQVDPEAIGAIGRRPGEPVPVGWQEGQLETQTFGGRVRRRPQGEALSVPTIGHDPVAGIQALTDKTILPASKNPLDDRILYHGSAGPIDEFDSAYLGQNTGTSDAEIGFHFAGDEPDAHLYMQMATEKARKRLQNEGIFENLPSGFVGKYRINAKNPLIIGMEDATSSVQGAMREELLSNKMAARLYARDHGYDALVYPDGTDVDSGFTAVAFDPGQIVLVEAHEPIPQIQEPISVGREHSVKPKASASPTRVTVEPSAKRAANKVAFPEATGRPAPQTAITAPLPDISGEVQSTAGIRAVHDAPVTDVLNLSKLDVEKPAQARLAEHVESLRTLREGERRTWAQADVDRPAVRQQILSDLSAGDPLVFNPKRARALSGEQLVAMRDIVSANDDLIATLSKRVESGALPHEQHIQAERMIEQAMQQNDHLLQDLVVGSSQKGRDLNMLRRVANRNLDPETWMIQAKRMLGDQPLTDEIRTTIRRLSHEAVAACGGAA